MVCITAAVGPHTSLKDMMKALVEFFCTTFAPRSVRIFGWEPAAPCSPVPRKRRQYVPRHSVSPGPMTLTEPNLGSGHEIFAGKEDIGVEDLTSDELLFVLDLSTKADGASCRETGAEVLPVTLPPVPLAKASSEAQVGTSSFLQVMLEQQQLSPKTVLAMCAPARSPPSSFATGPSAASVRSKKLSQKQRRSLEQTRAAAAAVPTPPMKVTPAPWASKPQRAYVVLKKKWR